MRETVLLRDPPNHTTRVTPRRVHPGWISWEEALERGNRPPPLERANQPQTHGQARTCDATTNGPPATNNVPAIRPPTNRSFNRSPTRVPPSHPNSETRHTHVQPVNAPATIVPQHSRSPTHGLHPAAVTHVIPESHINNREQSNDVRQTNRTQEDHRNNVTPTPEQPATNNASPHRRPPTHVPPPHGTHETHPTANMSPTRVPSHRNSETQNSNAPPVNTPNAQSNRSKKRQSRCKVAHLEQQVQHLKAQKKALKQWKYGTTLNTRSPDAKIKRNKRSNEKKKVLFKVLKRMAENQP